MHNIKALSKNYFTDKNYVAIYLHGLSHAFADALIGVFTGAFFYSLGMPIYFILLFYGLEFGLRGIFSPLGTILPKKIGIPMSFLVSYIFLLIFFFMVSLSGYSLAIGFFAFIFHSVFGGIYYSLIRAIHSVYVKDCNRGREATLENVLNSIFAVLAIVVGGVILKNGHYYLMALIASAALLLSLIPYFTMLKKIEVKETIGFMDSYRYLASKEYRQNNLPFFGKSLIIMGRILLPLFIFIIVGDFEVLGVVVGLSLLVEMVFTLLYGKYIDGHRYKSTSVSAVFLGFGFVFFMFLAKNPFSAFLVDSYNKVSANLFNDSYDTRTYAKAKESKKPFLFCSTEAISLCFSEIIVLLIYALLAYYMGNAVFTVIFGFSILGIYISVKYFKD